MNDYDEAVFNISHVALNGRTALEVGLPAPTAVTRQSVVPVATWSDANFGAVLFLLYSSRDDGSVSPSVIRGVFRRGEHGYSPLANWSGSGWSHDPLAVEGSVADLADRAIYLGGGSSTYEPRDGEPALVLNGRHSTQVTSITLIQGNATTTNPASGHWGAWIACVAKWAPYAIEARGRDGVLLGRLEGPQNVSHRKP